MIHTSVNEALLDAARQGDAAALDSLLVACRPNLRRYAASQCARSSDVDDAVQEALIIVYRKLPALRSIGSFAAWLFQVARRECQRLSRSMFRQAVPLDELDESR